jgi:hypothetical protein
MIAEIPYMLVWGYFSAMGWMSANWTVEKIIPDKPEKTETQICSEWKEERQSDNSIQRTRTCEPTTKASQ